MIYGKKGLEIKPFASDDFAASSSRMVSSAITLIRSSMCSASASVFGFLASTYLAIVFKASIGLVIGLRYVVLNVSATSGSAHAFNSRKPAGRTRRGRVWRRAALAL